MPVNYKKQWRVEDIINLGFSLPASSQTYSYLLKCSTKKPRWGRGGSGWRMVIAGTFGNLKNWPQKTGSRAVQLAAERINSTSATETARKNCYSAASRKRKVMLPLGERAENSLSTENQKILTLLAVNYFHMH